MRQLDDATFTDRFKNEVRSISTAYLYSMYLDARGHGALIGKILQLIPNRLIEQSGRSAVFTGSSQDELAALVAAAGGPMYQFAQLLDFPVLDDEYLRLLANHFARVHRGKHLDIAGLERVFEKIGYKPALLKDLVKSMSAEGVTDVDFALQLMMKDDRQVAGWRGLLAGLQPLDREVLLQVVQGNAPLGQGTLRTLRNIASLKPTIARVRKALDNLKRAGILAKPGGSYIVEDRLFAEYLATLTETDSAARDPIPKSAGNRVVVEYHQKSREKK